MSSCFLTRRSRDRTQKLVDHKLCLFGRWSQALESLIAFDVPLCSWTLGSMDSVFVVVLVAGFL